MNIITNPIRGGSAWSSAWDCRSAYRSAGDPGFRYGYVGFRTVIAGPQTQPACVDARGGSWYSHALFCRVAYRNRGVPSYRKDNLGFRTVL